MKIPIVAVLCLAISPVLFSWKAPGTGILVAAGTQPQLAVDPGGVIRMVFGRTDSIFCATSTNIGISFSVPVLVGTITGMHLGMSRGPQIASSLHATIITAMDKTGDIHFFQMENNNGKWVSKGYVNNLRSEKDILNTNSISSLLHRRYSVLQEGLVCFSFILMRLL